MRLKLKKRKSLWNMKTSTRHYPVSVHKHTFASAVVTDTDRSHVWRKGFLLAYTPQSIMEEAGQEIMSGNVKAGTEAEARRNDAN